MISSPIFLAPAMMSSGGGVKGPLFERLSNRRIELTFLIYSFEEGEARACG
jgi:hypothetical protein